ncbi:MAG: ABC transporter transmembrane domain-containing protein, partial [Candidatus Saccharibacteria bacterium]|nr:ABC transporter transmembrane domain-containing protein [Candidatus Saccharibacteria bacterium]
MEKKSVDTYSNWDLVRDLWRWLGKYRVRFLATSFLLLISEVSWLYPTYVLAKIVSLLTVANIQASRAELSFLVVSWFAVMVFRLITKQLSQYVNYQISERLALEVELLTVNHMLKLDLAWQERENAGNKLKRIQRGAGFVQTLLNEWNDSLLPGLVGFVGVVIILSSVDRFVGSLMALFIVSYYGLSTYLMRRVAAAVDNVNKGSEDVSGLEFEAVSNVRTVKALGFAGTIIQRMARLNTELFKKIRIRILQMRARHFITEGWGYCFRIGLTVYVINRILAGTYEAGFLILVYNYHDRVWMAISQIAKQNQQFIIARHSIARMMDI